MRFLAFGLVLVGFCETGCTLIADIDRRDIEDEPGLNPSGDGDSGVDAGNPDPEPEPEPEPTDAAAPEPEPDDGSLMEAGTTDPVVADGGATEGGATSDGAAPNNTGTADAAATPDGAAPDAEGRLANPDSGLGLVTEGGTPVFGVEPEAPVEPPVEGGANAGDASVADAG